MPADPDSRLAWRDWSWFDRTFASHRAAPEHRLPEPMASPYASADHGACSSAQSNTMWRSAVSATAVRLAREQLADRHPARLLVDDRAEPRDQVREIRLIAVVDVLLALPGRVALDRQGSRAAPGA